MIIDCFPFFNELDLLEVRLNELKDVVDMFVITESTHTFSGIDKPLHFIDNKERFKGFNIVYTVYKPDKKLTPAEYEVLQKQFNLDVAFGMAEPGDIIMHGDVDEIPNAAVVRHALKDNWQAARFSMTLFYYYMNCMSTTKASYKNTRLVRYTEPFKYISSQKFKTDLTYYNSGWHFSFLGDVQDKLKSYNHAPEYDKPPFNDPEHIKTCLEQGTDLFMRVGSSAPKFKFINDDLTYLPRYVQDNQERFKKYIK